MRSGRGCGPGQKEKRIRWAYRRERLTRSGVGGERLTSMDLLSREVRS